MPRSTSVTRTCMARCDWPRPKCPNNARPAALPPSTTLNSPSTSQPVRSRAGRAAGDIGLGDIHVGAGAKEDAGKDGEERFHNGFSSSPAAVRLEDKPRQIVPDK